MPLKPEIPSSPFHSSSHTQARYQKRELVEHAENEIRRIVAGMLSNHVDEEDIRRLREGVFRKIEKLTYNRSDPLMVSRIVLESFIDMVADKYEKSEKRYGELVAEGVPRSTKIEDAMDSITNRIKELRNNINNIKTPRDITRETLIAIENLYVNARLVESLIRKLEEVKDIAMKIAKGEKITWREAETLSQVYYFSIIEPLVHPRSVRIPPLKQLKEYAGLLAKYGWKPMYMVITRESVSFNDPYFLIGFMLDEKVELPGELKRIGIFLEEIGDDAIDRIAGEGLEIVVTSKGFMVKGAKPGHTIRFYFEDKPGLNPVTVERVKQLGEDYAILEYSKNTVRILEKMPRVAIASTGGVVVDECENKCYVIPSRILGVKTVENRIGNVLTASVSCDAWRPFIEVMKRSSTGYLILADRKDLLPVSLVFRDKSGVEVFAIPQVISTKRVNADSIREVNFVKVKPKPYLGKFIGAFTWPVEILHPPVLLTHDGHLMIITDNLIYLTPEKARINKPVKVNQYLLSQLYGPLYLGLVPVEPGTDEESIRLAEKGVRVYELLRRARKVGTYEFKNPPYDVDWGKIPGSVEYMLYELQTMLRFKGRVKINTYRYEENGVSADIVEAVISRNVRILSA